MGVTPGLSRLPTVLGDLLFTKKIPPPTLQNLEPISTHRSKRQDGESCNADNFVVGSIFPELRNSPVSSACPHLTPPSSLHKEGGGVGFRRENPTASALAFNAQA